MPPQTDRILSPIRSSTSAELKCHKFTFIWCILKCLHTFACTEYMNAPTCFSLIFHYFLWDACPCILWLKVHCCIFENHREARKVALDLFTCKSAQFSSSLKEYRSWPRMFESTVSRNIFHLSFSTTTFEPQAIACSPYKYCTGQIWWMVTWQQIVKLNASVPSIYHSSAISMQCLIQTF